MGLRPNLTPRTASFLGFSGFISEARWKCFGRRVLLVSGYLACWAASGCKRDLGRADLVFINGSEPELLDPALITAQPSSRVAYALFEGLTIFGPDAAVKPGVASHWTLSEDGKV